VARQQFISSAEAGKILGVSDDFFEGLAAKEDWIRPIMLSRKVKRWDKKDVLCLAHIIAKRAMLGAAEKPSPEP
jgi:hypothetical protein